MPESVACSTDLATAMNNMDASVAEVFTTMMGMEITPTEGWVRQDGLKISSVVGLAGSLRGAFTLYVHEEAALRIAQSLTGVDFATVDETVTDAIGELGNMLAGAWKGRFPQYAHACALSVPTVVVGTSYELHMKHPGLQFECAYRFEDHFLCVRLVCEG